MKRCLLLVWLWPLLALADGMPDDPCGRPGQPWEEVIPYKRPDKPEKPAREVAEPGVLWLLSASGLVACASALLPAWKRRRYKSATASEKKQASD